MLVCCL